MSNEQSSVEWLIKQYQMKGYIVLQDELQAKAMHKEEIDESYRDGFEFALLNECAKQSTMNASEYSQGYNKGFLAALEYMNSTIENKIKLRQYEQR